MGHDLAGVVHPGTDQADRKGELRAQTRRLLPDAERADYRKLRTNPPTVPTPTGGTTLWALVIDLMLADTTKHATMLRFLERRRRPW